ncbi:MAG: HD domain-containing phosphohydrolase [Pseudomonadota bacterium]
MKTLREGVVDLSNHILVTGDGAERDEKMSAEQQTSRKILVVDDDRDFRWTMGNVLQAAGYRVIQAQDGKEAMSLLEKDIPDLVLLDHRMPGQNGLHVARDMKQRIPALPIVIITAYAEVASAVDFLKMGVYDYVAKPVDNNDLIFTIKRALEKQDLVQEVKHLEEERRQSVERLLKAAQDTVHAIALTVEIRDPYTAGHQRGVVQIACAIAKEMSLSEHQINGIRMAGIIHDIGKISVPAEILSKPGRITENEFGIIKAHPQIAYDILKGIDFPWPVAQIVLQHHERMDGSGYPQGILGEEILTESRILAVADIVEAMASHRPYRPALGIDKALEEISQNRGILYDPEAVDACLKLFHEKGYRFN